MKRSIVLSEFKKKLDAIFAFYSKFSTSNYFSVLSAVILIVIITTIVIIFSNYQLTTFFGVRSTFSNFIKGQGGFYLFLIEQSSYIWSISFLNIALLSDHFLSFSQNGVRVPIKKVIQQIDSKTWGFYFSSILVISLFQLFPSPYFGYWESNLMDLVSFDRGPFWYEEWLYNMILLIAYVLTISFANILTLKRKPSLKSIPKNWNSIFTIFFIIVIFDSVFASFTDFLGVYVNTPIRHIIGNSPTYSIFLVFIWCLKMALIALFLPAILTIMKDNKIENHPNSPKMVDDKVLDNDL